MQKLGRKLLITIILAVVIYLLLGIYSNSNEQRESFADFEWQFLPIILLLAFFNYITRFSRWVFYCRKLCFSVEKGQNITIFGTGLLMTLTPGKSGELVKSYLLKESYSIPISCSAPIVLAERITDFIAVLLLSGVGFFVYSFSKAQLLSYGLYIVGAFVFLILVTVILIFTIKKNKIKVPFFASILDWIHHFLTTTRSLLEFRQMIIALGLSIPAWFGECLGFYYTLNSFNVELPLTTSVFIYAFATIVGAVTFLPGGLGGTEASMTGLIVSFGISRGKAVASTIVIRACTLWFAALVGVVCFVAYNVLKPKQRKSAHEVSV